MDTSRVTVRIKRLPRSEGLPLPAPASAGASGLDLLACVDEEIRVEPGESRLIPTGLCAEIPKGYEAQVRPRSGLALRSGITILNTPGTIDSDYRGEIGVILINHGREAFTIKRGDRIAQLVFSTVCQPVLEEVDDLEDSARGPGGFGHTGI
jgi:dUTP pyrophosphatase